MTNEIVGDNANKINEFKKIYEELANTLIYDEKETETAYLEDGVEELSAYEMRQKNAERTKIYKVGGSFTLAMRLSEELTSLEIENYLMEVQRNNTKQWVNLYKSNENWYVADLTEDIFFRDRFKQSGITKKPLYANVLAEEFLIYNGKCSTLEEIKDDGKKIEELKMKTFNYFNIETGKVNQEELSLMVEKKNVFEKIKKIFKDVFDKIIDAFVKPKEEYEYSDEEKEMVEEGILEGRIFISKSKINEKEAIKKANEKVEQDKKEQYEPEIED